MNNKLLMLVSILLALTLWTYAFLIEKSELTIKVPIKFENVKDEHMVISQPAEVTVKFEGAKVFLAKVVDSAQITLNVAGLPVGSTYMHIPTTDIKIAGVDVKEMSPNIVELEVLKTTKKSVKISPMVFDESPKGYKIGAVTVEPDTVRVEGKASVLKEINTVYTVYTTIGDEYGIDNVSIDLVSMNGVKSIVPPAVKLKVTMIQDIVTKSVYIRPLCLDAGVATKEQIDRVLYTDVLVELKGRSDYVDTLISANSNGNVAKTDKSEANTAIIGIYCSDIDDETKNLKIVTIPYRDVEILSLSKSRVDLDSNLRE